MKIKIIKCSSPLYWYEDKIGEVYNVLEDMGSWFIVDTIVSPFYVPNRTELFVDKKDCMDYTFQSLVREIINE